MVDVGITEVTGSSERDAALDMLQRVPSSGILYGIVAIEGDWLAVFQR